MNTIVAEPRVWHLWTLKNTEGLSTESLKRYLESARQKAERFQQDANVLEQIIAHRQATEDSRCE